MVLAVGRGMQKVGVVLPRKEETRGIVYSVQPLKGQPVATAAAFPTGQRRIERDREKEEEEGEGRRTKQLCGRRGTDRLVDGWR